MNEKLAVTGSVCKSTDGHDKGRLYLITAKVNNSVVYICDGEYRTVSAPKKKNLKHLEFLGAACEEVMKKLTEAGSLTDEEIKYAIKEFKKMQALKAR